jgi:hypothetical protein
VFCGKACNRAYCCCARANQANVLIGGKIEDNLQVFIQYVDELVAHLGEALRRDTESEQEQQQRMEYLLTVLRNRFPNLMREAALEKAISKKRPLPKSMPDRYPGPLRAGYYYDMLHDMIYASELAYVKENEDEATVEQRRGVIHYRKPKIPNSRDAAFGIALLEFLTPIMHWNQKDQVGVQESDTVLRFLTGTGQLEERFNAFSETDKQHRVAHLYLEPLLETVQNVIIEELDHPAPALLTRLQTDKTFRQQALLPVFIEIAVQALSGIYKVNKVGGNIQQEYLNHLRKSSIQWHKLFSQVFRGLLSPAPPSSPMALTPPPPLPPPM